MIAAGVCGLTAVLAGTFAAHGLKGRLAPDLLEDFQIGAHYHLAHAIALLAVAAIAGAMPQSKLTRAAGWCMVFGVIVFSGSLYILALTGETRLGMITPIGGVGFLVGWALLVIAGWRGRG